MDIRSVIIDGFIISVGSGTHSGSGFKCVQGFVKRVLQTPPVLKVIRVLDSPGDSKQPETAIVAAVICYNLIISAELDKEMR